MNHKEIAQDSDELNPLLILSIYNLLKNEAKYESDTRILTSKTKRAWNILVEEMFNVDNTSLFDRLISKMIQNEMIFLDYKQNKIIFKK